MPIPPRPDQTGQWATVPVDALDVIRPPVALQERGFRFQEVVDFQTQNWAWKYGLAWGDHVSRTVSTFTAIEDVLDAPVEAPIEIGDTFYINEDDSDEPPGTVVDVYELVAGTECRGVAATGKSVIVALVPAGASEGDPVTIRRTDRDGVLSAVTYTSAAVIAPNPSSPVSDGAIIAYAGRDSIEVWDHELGGAALWSATYASIPNYRKLALDHLHVYVTEGNTVEARDRATGALVWTYPHGGEVLDVVSDGPWVYLLGMASANPSAATLRRIRAADGADADGEGGLGTATGAWNAAPVVASGLVAWLGLDGARLYVVRGTGPAPLLDAYNQLGDLEWTVTPTANGSNPNLGEFDVDQDWIIGGSGVAYGFEKDRGNARWIGLVTPDLVSKAVSDGTAVWAGLYDGTNQLARIRRGNKVQLFRRIDPATKEWAPWRRHAVPA